MAYDIANALRIRTPDPIGVDQLKRKNALAERDQAVQEQNAASYRNQLDMAAQARQQQTSDAQLAQYKQQGAAVLGWLDQNDGKPEAAQMLAELAQDPQAQAVTRALGIDAARLGDRAYRMAAKAKLGVGPSTEKPYSLQTQQGPFGSQIVTDGSRFQVIEPQRGPAATKPAWKLVDMPTADGKVQKVWVDENNPDAKPRPFGDAAPPQDKSAFNRADKLRDEYNSASKEFVTIGDAYTRVQQAAAEPSAAGDLSMIFAYMKMLDPNSVVREQEFANAQNAAGVPDQVRNLWNRALNGQRLNPNQRKDFLSRAESLYKGQKKRHDSTVRARYESIAKRWNINPQDVVGDLDVTDAAAGPKVGDVQDGYRFKGGDPADPKSWEKAQ